MTTMIERVARAIEGEIDTVELVSAAPHVIRALRANRIARVAIAAMREPTEEMIKAGDDTAGTLAITHDYSAIGTWQDMIDAALASGKERP